MMNPGNNEYSEHPPAIGNSSMHASEAAPPGWTEKSQDAVGAGDPPSYASVYQSDNKAEEEMPQNEGLRGAPHIDVNGIALATSQGFSRSALKYVWYARGEEFQVHCELGCYYDYTRQCDMSLLMDLFTSDQSSKFFMARSSETQPVAAGEDPGLTGENAVAVVRALCRFVKNTITGIEVNMRYKWMGMTYDGWTATNRLNLRRKNGRLYMGCNGNDPKYLYDTGSLRLQTGNDAELRASLERSERENDDLANKLKAAQSATSRAQQSARSKTSGLNKQLETARQRANGLRTKMERVEGELARANQNWRASQDLARQQERQISQLNERVKKLRSENDGLSRKMGRIMRENERYQDVQQDFEYRKAEFEQFKRQQEGLEDENSMLRDKISVLMGNSRRLDSKFWTRKEMLSEFGEIGAELHLNVMRALQDSESMEMDDWDINVLLWQVLFSVNRLCQSKFAALEAGLCLKKNRALRNEFMSKIHDYFEYLLDSDGIFQSVCESFSKKLGAFTQDERFVRYVTRSAMFCWVMALKSDPQLEFYPEVEDEGIVNTVFGKKDFDSILVAHSDCRGLRKAKFVRVLQYVLPGLRRVEDGEIEVYPCVMAEAVKESEVEEKTDSIPAVEVAVELVVDGKVPQEDVANFVEPSSECEQEGGPANDEPQVEAEPGAAEPMDVDEDEDEDEKEADGEADGNESAVTVEHDGQGADAFGASSRAQIWKLEKQRVEKLLTDGDVEDAFGILKACGLDMDSGNYVLTLTCAECGKPAGQLSNDPDAEFGCENPRHAAIAMDNMFSF